MNNKKKLADGLLDPDELFLEQLKKGPGLKKPKNDIFEKKNIEYETSDGRKLLNEKQ